MPTTRPSSMTCTKYRPAGNSLASSACCALPASARFSNKICPVRPMMRKAMPGVAACGSSRVKAPELGLGNTRNSKSGSPGSLVDTISCAVRQILSMSTTDWSATSSSINGFSTWMVRKDSASSPRVAKEPAVNQIDVSNSHANRVYNFWNKRKHEKHCHSPSGYWLQVKNGFTEA